VIFTEALEKSLWGQSIDIVLNSKDCHGTKRLAMTERAFLYGLIYTKMKFVYGKQLGLHEPIS